MSRVLQLFLALFVVHRSIATPVLSPPTIRYGGQCAADPNSSTDSDISSLLREKVLPSLNCPVVGSCKDTPGTSCKNIADENPNAQSGNYWVRLCDGSVIQVYCDMSSRCCNSTRGWMRAAYLNTTDPATRDCPAGTFMRTTDGKRLCRRKLGPGCKSIFFPVHYMPYSRVCGRIIAYQDGSADAFWQYHRDNTITVDDDYLDGISITVGYPRTHVWSFAVSQTEGGEGADTLYACPCSRTDVPTEGVVPPFIGNDYFCESGTSNGWAQNSVLYVDDPLWDGENCPENSSCCELNNPPWFCKDLGREFRSDFEVRLCGDEELGNEDVPLELIELYVQ